VSRNRHSNLQEHTGLVNHRGMQRRKPDERVRRTHQRLGSALVELIQEKSVDDVTVQEVLDRASVGRSTFYLHFRGTDDLLLSQLEGFLEMMSTSLSIRKEASNRVVPVAEMFEHISNQRKVYRALADSGRLPRFLRSRARLFHPRNRETPSRIRATPETSAERIERSRRRFGGKSPVAPAMVDGSRRERTPAWYGRAIPPNRVERAQMITKEYSRNPEEEPQSPASMAGR
jgi:AcrR family transcriptional regulator